VPPAKLLYHSIMNILHSVILGVIEGFTEFLPISSTAHLILAGKLLDLQQSEFLKSFDIVIQLGAILSVVVLYWKSFFNIEIIKRLIVSMVPTILLGLVFYKIVKTYFMGNLTLILWAMLLGGVALIIFEYWHKEKEGAQNEVQNITYKQAFKIGTFQSLAMVPGVSRAAATIIGGLMLNIKRQTVAEYSFLLAVPTMLAASTLDIYKNYKSFSVSNVEFLLVGFIVSFIVAILSIKFLLGYIKKHDFKSFGIYRIAAAIVFWLFILK